MLVAKWSSIAPLLSFILSGARRAFAPAESKDCGCFRRSAAAEFLVLALLLSARQYSRPNNRSRQPVVLDRAVAVVNKQVILASDLDDESDSPFSIHHGRSVEITRQQALDS